MVSGAESFDSHVVGYTGQDASVELQLSPDGNELAIVDLMGKRRRCEARVPADHRRDLAAALARMAEAAQRQEFSDAPAKVPATDGGRIDVAALPAEVAIYVFRPGAWMSRSVRLAPDDARRLAQEVRERARAIDD
jgi:hypothetical protein